MRYNDGRFRVESDVLYHTYLAYRVHHCAWRAVGRRAKSISE